MASRFVRENSQFLASVFITGYTGFSVFYKINLADIVREDYEFKSKRGTYLGLSSKEEDFARKFLYRLNNSDSTFEFFRTNSIDFVSFGFNKLRQGCHIGLPISYLANDTKEILEQSPPNGFQNFFGQTIQINKLDSETLEKLQDNLVLSQDAKLFGLAREVAHTNHFVKSITENIIELVALSSAYVYSYVRTRALKMQLAQRRRVYFASGLTALGVILASKIFIQKFLDNLDDHEACQMGLDCSEGSIEFYDKLLNRNKILRQVLLDGEKLISPEGNYLKQVVKVPFVDKNIYVKFNGEKLTERKQNCKKHLAEMVSQLLKQNAENEAKRSKELQDDKQAKPDDKELKIFRDIRLKLESLIHSK